ncbi:MAG: hypothetical protein NC394_06790 [Bacteroides sp.]|nr:hypothetical protein [Bacteroides sp.]
MSKFDSKTFNAEAFGAYVNKIPNVNKSELARSGAVQGNENAKLALSGQSGSLYARIPYFGRINGSTSQNNDGSSNVTSSSTTTYEQGFVAASRMDSWTERSFSRNITAGADFMDSVAEQIGEYKQEVKQGILLAMLKGIFSMNTEGSSVRAKGAKEFVENHTLDITGEEEPAVGATTLNRAVQKACGDNKSAFSLVIMHSEVATNLENLQLMKYLTYTDRDGITRDLSLGSWNGRTVLVDDGMPAEEAADGKGTAYTTYILGKGAITLDDIGDSVPYEMSRDARTNGGEDTLYVRDRYICGADGLSFEKPADLVGSASNEELANGENWAVINDGTKHIPHKSIAIARIISKG